MPSDFPSYYRYFSVPSFVFQGRTIMNHQRMLQTYPGADGLKTGYIDASGFNVVTSALWGETRLIGVVLGAASGWERDQHMALLLDQGFERMGASMLAAQREPAPPFGLSGFVGVAQAAPELTPPLFLTRPAGRRGPAAKAFQYAASPRIHAASHRRAPEARERMRARPILALLPTRAAAARAAGLRGDVLAPRAGRPGGTRTANRGMAGRFPG